MNLKTNAITAAAIGAAVFAVCSARPASADVFIDTFANGPSNTYVEQYSGTTAPINQDTGSPRQSYSGSENSLPITYTLAVQSLVNKYIQLDNPNAPTGNNIQMTGVNGQEAYASPDLNLAPTLLSPVTVSYDVTTEATGSGDTSTGNWAGVVIGASAQNEFVNANNGFSVILEENGNVQAFNQSGANIQATGATYTPNASGYAADVTETLTALGDFSVTINGTPLTFSNGLTTYVGTAVAENYVTLISQSSPGSGTNNSWFSDLEISNGAVSAAPEPSQIGMLALIAFGLGGLLLMARKRGASSLV